MDKILQELKKLKNIYQNTEEFQIGKDLKVKLRVLTSEEESYINSYAMKYEEGVGYLFAIKRGSVARSIIELNGQELPDFIVDVDEETGETEKLERHDWVMKNVVSGWSQLLIDKIWEKYVILMTEVEKSIEDNISDEDNEEKSEEAEALPQEE